ncbi:MAG: hypothetical protein UV74_C0002G0025 [Candidatus Woesebacteria bacterium GW2011_GWB1_43_14]|uniref:Uncharacterized protein n=1 Tax=Candidatus Woesebacteria bacterium GW2011_GWB1_43_14 TaxID=1618578 RepID=A0A0G1FUY3_9BACT|nr:MAG: hypothetical protein UV51_C0004G0072 [Candidatus Woesebacteria bacterium GW2011_GWC1_42_9]KKS98806.1 MAG: hypothetical protein UV74_C0002G0025 [Candidatus Woesebacteria bacterium GW2011_GWB1_43_14]
MVAQGYTIINNIDFEPGEVVIEIGSERGEGSTGYLDNFDWTYEGTENIPRVRRCVAKYKELGVDLNNTDSQKAHLQQSVLVSDYVAKNGVILFDDTWQPSEGVFSGKGGTAVPWLLSHGFEIYKTYNTPNLEWNFVSVIKTS